jgi:hypothetical protein
MDDDLARCTTFWAAVVLPGLPCTITVPKKVECALTNAALDQDEGRPDSGRTVLFLSVNGSSPVSIFPFTIGVCESSSIQLRFVGNDRITFTTSGIAVRIHIAGYLKGGVSLDVDNGAEAHEDSDE